ncbi:TPA: TM2 domain-containing protein [Staphylococcus aureus]|nr:TM2 domain-containing protein [Staphylococcus aureus]HDB5456847.1 TM2 domain-containing protein [Staphylococcus aureus]HDB5459828.1 TM2 domain-containing protein [Staphylococcus aureus]
MQVNKVIYILLALFLGSFGIHKFYAGKNMQGILHLIFCWTGIPHLIFCWTGIPHILAIISAVITVFKPADEQGNVTL